MIPYILDINIIKKLNNNLIKKVKRLFYLLRSDFGGRQNAISEVAMVRICDEAVHGCLFGGVRGWLWMVLGG